MNVEQLKEIRRFSRKLSVLYDFFSWTWRDNVSSPTPLEIEKTILRLIGNIRKHNTYASSTGGLHVEKDEDGRISITWSKDETLYL